MRKEPTCTSLVTDFLRGADDFRTAEQIMENTQLLKHRVMVALDHLRKHQVVDCLAEEGKLWWFILPTGTDQRCRCVDQRKPEGVPRRPRKKKT